MTTSSTTLLGLALPVTGELSNTWGDVVNASLTNLLDTAIAGTTTLSSDADVTLTTTTLSANQARQAVILWTAGGTATRTITAPAQSKPYIVINKTSSSQSIKIVGVGPTTGVTIVAGTAALVAWNGVDFVTISVTSTTGVLPVANGGTGLTAGTSGGILAYTATGTLASSGLLAANALVLGGGAGVAPSTTTTGAGVVTALGIAPGSVGGMVLTGGAFSGTSVTASSLTSGRVTYAGASGLLQDSANLTFNGTTLTAAGLSSSENTVFASAGNTKTVQIGSLSAPANVGTLQQTFNGASVWGAQTTVGGETDFGWNFYYYGGFKSRLADVASRLSFNATSGRVSFWTAPNPGSADAALTFTEALRIDATTGVTALGAMAVGNGLSVTGTISATGTAATNTTGLTLQGTTTGFNRERIFNTGGDLRFGIDSSVGAEALTGSAAYSSFIGSFTNTPFYLVSNSAIVGTVSSTGLAVTGTLSATGVATFAAGTVALPSITTTGDTNTGVYFPAADTVGITTAGAERMSIDSSGNVLITGASAVTLEVKALVNTAAALKLSSTGGIQAGMFMAAPTVDSSLGFQTGGTERMRLDASGNLGIGTSSPAAKLDVQAATGTFKLASSTGTNAAYLYATNTGGDFYFGRDNSTGTTFSTGSAYSAVLYSSNAYPMVFFTSAAEKMRLDASGNLLVATTSAVSGSKLVVASGDATIYGVTVGRGGGAVSTNTAVGASALTTNSSGAFNSAFGVSALQLNIAGVRNVAVGYTALANNTASYNTAVGMQALLTNTSGANNVAIGNEALVSNTTASNNTAVGYQAGYTNSAGTQNVFIGRISGYSSTSNFNTFIGDTSGYNSTGQLNTFLGWGSGYLITTGSKNTIIGGYSGNQGGLDIRTASNYVVLSDGDGEIVAFSKTGQTFALQGGTLSTGTGIAFPATQSASTDANTLDDYEEGTWTPSLTSFTVVGSPTYTGFYTKVGRQVTVVMQLTATTIASGGSSFINNLPFSAAVPSVGSAAFMTDNGGTGSASNGYITGVSFYSGASSATQYKYLTATYFTS